MAVPRRYNRYVEAPHLAADGQDRIWLALRVRTATAQNRTDFWANNGRWELFLTSLEGSRWTPAAPLPGSSTRPDGVFQLAGASRGVWAAWMNDNRFFGGPGVAGNRGVHQEIDAARFAYGAPREAELEAFAEAPGNAAAMHRDERADVVEAMRKRHAYGAIDRIDIVKDGKFVFENRPDREAAEFTWVDNAPGNGRSWYYVRVIQADRQMAWSSPIRVDYSRR